MKTPSSFLSGIGKASGGFSIVRAFSLLSTMGETVLERLEHEQQADQPLIQMERAHKRTVRSLEIEDAKEELISRVKAANVERKLASVNAAIELSKTELDLAVAESKHDRLKIFNDTSIPMAQKMIMINAIQTSITAKIAAYNALFGQATTLATVTESVPATTVDMSAYEDFSTVSDTDDVNL